MAEDRNAGATLRQMLTSFWITQSLYAAAELGVADAMAGGAQDVNDIAQRTGADEGALYRLLRALASIGVFKETQPRRFEQTPLSDFLRKDVPGSFHGLALYIGRAMIGAWSEIVHSIRTGEPAFDRKFGKPIFAHLEQHPDLAAIFDAAMTGQTVMIGRAVAAAYDFTPFRTIVDVGGGKGALLAAILPSAPQARGINFDQSSVVDRARSYIAAAGLAQRCQAVGGDFFAEVPAGGDAYLMKFVLHDWDDERCVTILRNVARIMTRETKLLIIESVIPPGNDPYPGKFMDINMLVITGGRERTEAEYRTLLDRADLTMARSIPAHPLASIIEATRSQ